MTTDAPPPETPVVAEYPVALDARLDEPLNRWLWLVKWFLAIPHYVVLAFLWVLFILVTLVAFFAIIITARYPRSLFFFNLGILRWTWRVAYYSTTVLGTDRYPPFSLDPEPDYPASLDVVYPERLSRWKPLVKWLFAFPHWIIVAAFLGTGHVGTIGALTFVSVLLLAVQTRYPRNLHELTLGMVRWVARVAIYVALMRDEYPPFRLEP